MICLVERAPAPLYIPPGDDLAALLWVIGPVGLVGRFPFFLLRSLTAAARYATPPPLTGSN